MNSKYLKATRAGAILALAMGTVAMMANSATAEPASHSTVGVVNLEGPIPAPVAGAFSTITRTDNGIHATITTNDLPAGAYTVWILVFNNPGDCVAPGPICLPSAGDIPNSNGGVHFGAGQVVNGGHPTTFSVNLAVGDDSDQIGGPSPLLNPRGAEIHVAIRWHGPAVPGLIREQIRTVGGGCSSDALPGMSDEIGFGCFEIQAAPHLGE